jgi:hypothetical protein
MMFSRKYILVFIAMALSFSVYLYGQKISEKQLEGQNYLAECIENHDTRIQSLLKILVNAKKHSKEQENAILLLAC